MLVVTSIGISRPPCIRGDRRKRATYRHITVFWMVIVLFLLLVFNTIYFYFGSVRGSTIALEIHAFG